MTTPNRPSQPDWYQSGRTAVPPHVGPTQRELLARRIRSLRRIIVTASFIGTATFAMLAARQTTATAHPAPQTAITQQASSTPQTPSTSFFSGQSTSVTSATSSTGSDDATTSNSATQQVIPSAPVTTSPLFTQPTSPIATSGFRTRTRSS